MAETLTYDAPSRVTQRTDARGLITKYIYDNADRLTLVEYRLANNTLVSDVDYTYDDATAGSRWWTAWAPRPTAMT
jgi:hypothetical protein